MTSSFRYEIESNRAFKLAIGFDEIYIRDNNKKYLTLWKQFIILLAQLADRPIDRWSMANDHIRFEYNKTWRTYRMTKNPFTDPIPTTPPSNDNSGGSRQVYIKKTYGVMMPFQLREVAREKYPQHSLVHLVEVGLMHIINGNVVVPPHDVLVNRVSRTITLRVELVEMARSQMPHVSTSYLITTALYTALVRGVADTPTMATNEQSIRAEIEAQRIAQQHGASIEQLRQSDKYKVMEQHLMGLEGEED